MKKSFPQSPTSPLHSQPLWSNPYNRNISQALIHVHLAVQLTPNPLEKKSLSGEKRPDGVTVQLPQLRQNIRENWQKYLNSISPEASESTPSKYWINSMCKKRHS